MTNVVNNVTKQARVLAALENTDKGLTEAQISARFGVGNARSTVRALRMKGFAIYANRSTNSKGVTKTFYRLGSPSKAVVAAGYKAISAGLV